MQPAACAPLLVLAAAAVACTKPVGSEGGPCTGGGACDPGLVCLSDLCVDPNGADAGPGEGGEGEGECLGDEPATADRGDCGTLPTAGCAPLDENTAVQTCDLAGAILRTGLFQGAFDCFAAIPGSACGELDARVEACFGALRACPLEAASRVCGDIDAQCVLEGDDGFPTALCTDDLTLTNTGFRQVYVDCFNGAAGTPCAQVHEDCFNTAVNALVGG